MANASSLPARTIVYTFGVQSMCLSYILKNLSHLVAYRYFTLIAIQCLQWYGYLTATT